MVINSSLLVGLDEIYTYRGMWHAPPRCGRCADHNPCGRGGRGRHNPSAFLTAAAAAAWHGRHGGGARSCGLLPAVKLWAHRSLPSTLADAGGGERVSGRCVLPLRLRRQQQQQHGGFLRIGRRLAPRALWLFTSSATPSRAQHRCCCCCCCCCCCNGRTCPIPESGARRPHRRLRHSGAEEASRRRAGREL